MLQGAMLHTVKLLHSLQWQSSGHGCSLQDSSLRGGFGRNQTSVLAFLGLVGSTACEKKMPQPVLQKMCGAATGRRNCKAASDPKHVSH